TPLVVDQSVQARLRYDQLRTAPATDQRCHQDLRKLVVNLIVIREVLINDFDEFAGQFCIGELAVDEEVEVRCPHVLRRQNTADQDLRGQFDVRQQLHHR